MAASEILTAEPLETGVPFHPVVAAWFRARFGRPTEPQRLGWRSIAAGRHTLIAAPTGWGKTLAAFLGCLDRLFRAGDGRRTGKRNASRLRLAAQGTVATTSTAISRCHWPKFVRRRIEAGYRAPPDPVAVRTGDTPPAQRQALLRRPPHILVTTPESLYLMLTERQEPGSRCAACTR